MGLSNYSNNQSIDFILLNYYKQNLEKLLLIFIFIDKYLQNYSILINYYLI